MSDPLKSKAKLIIFATGLIVAIALIAVILFLPECRNPHPPQPPVTNAEIIEAPPPAPALPLAAVVLSEPPPPPSMSLADRLNNPLLAATEDVKTLFSISDSYFLNLQNRQGLPIRDDIDLAKVLTGKNPLKLVFLPPDHRAISSDGRLLDRWGTPYFIHPISGRLLEIHSAGPDRKMFTDDDLIAPPPQPKRSSGD
jgi:hypothetical protein